MTAANVNRRLPAYHRLYVILSEHIRDGVYPPSEMLPSEHELTRTYGVSRVTVRRALALLASEGLVRKRKGQGTVVALPPSGDPEPKRVRGPLRDLLALGVRSTSTQLFWGDVVPPAPVREKLGLGAGDRCLLIRRLRQFNEAPVSYSSIYLPEHVGARLDRRRAGHRLILQMLDETPYRPHYTEHVLTATIADGTVAESLGLPAGAPVLRMRGVAYDRRHRPVYFQESLYHPSKYEYAVRLARGKRAQSLLWRPATS